MFWCTLEKTGYSDSESFGGSLESLSSPGKHKPAFVSRPFLSHAYENLAKINMSDFPPTVSLLYGNEKLKLTGDCLKPHPL